MNNSDNVGLHPFLGLHQPPSTPTRKKSIDWSVVKDKDMRDVVKIPTVALLHFAGTVTARDQMNPFFCTTKPTSTSHFLF